MLLASYITQPGVQIAGSNATHISNWKLVKSLRDFLTSAVMILARKGTVGLYT